MLFVFQQQRQHQRQSNRHDAIAIVIAITPTDNTKLMLTSSVHPSVSTIGLIRRKEGERRTTR